MEIDIADVHQICHKHHIEIKDLQSVTGSFVKKIYFINQEFLLRMSESPMTGEQEKFRRVAALPCVPKIRYTGMLQREDGTLYYTLLTLLPGDDFVNVYPVTSQAKQRQLGVEVAGFLDALHELPGNRYDIGLYIPILPNFAGTWREGHQTYWEILRRDWQALSLQPGSIQVFEQADRYLQQSSPVLEFQSGPKLLHNDFHPKNILLSQGKFSGVIDWECSQFGEPDFELCHLIHWCLYPPQPSIDFREFLRGFFQASPQCARVPHLAQRLTIYQIEHEIQQILWNFQWGAGEAETWRVPRLVRWMEGSAAELLREVAA